MTDERIDPKVITQAIAAHEGRTLPAALIADPHYGADERERMEAPIRAADRERGLKDEHVADYARGSQLIEGRYSAPLWPHCEKRNERVRLVSDWRPVERGGEDD